MPTANVQNAVLTRRVPFTEPLPGFDVNSTPEQVLTVPAAQFLATLAGQAGAGGGTGSGGTVSVYNLDILGPAQMVDAPIMASGVGQQFIFRLTTQADPASIIWGAGFDGSADVRLNYAIASFTIFSWYAEDRGSGLLWYLSAPPYLPYL